MCLWNTMPPVATKFGIGTYFLAQRSESRSKGHWLWCHLKGHHRLSMHGKYEVSISYSSKVIANVKADKRQTGQKQHAPDHSMPGHKNYYLCFLVFWLSSWLPCNLFLCTFLLVCLKIKYFRIPIITSVMWVYKFTSTVS